MCFPAVTTEFTHITSRVLYSSIALNVKNTTGNSVNGRHITETETVLIPHVPSRALTVEFTRVALTVEELTQGRNMLELSTVRGVSRTLAL